MHIYHKPYSYFFLLVRISFVSFACWCVSCGSELICNVYKLAFISKENCIIIIYHNVWLDSPFSINTIIPFKCFCVDKKIDIKTFHCCICRSRALWDFAFSVFNRYFLVACKHFFLCRGPWNSFISILPSFFFFLLSIFHLNRDNHNNYRFRFNCNCRVDIEIILFKESKWESKRKKKHFSFLSFSIEANFQHRNA